MQQHKRNLPSEGAVPAPKKTRQLAAEMPPPTTMEDALKIIDMFKAEQAALVNHIVKTDANSLSKRPKLRIIFLQTLLNQRQTRHPRSKPFCSKVNGAYLCSPKPSATT